jgi:hypothetical protein
MRDIGRSIWVIALLVIIGALAGCGGSGSSSGSASTSAGTTKPEPSAEFSKSKGDAHIVKFGSEASASEREVANAVLETNLKARAAADFETQCATLNNRTLSEVAGVVAKDPVEECPGKLRKLAEPLSGTKKARANTLTEPIGVLRVKGARGWALYHGKDGKEYAMPMEKDGGIWKVGALLTTEL